METNYPKGSDYQYPERDELEREMIKQGKQTAKEPGKKWGHCAVCEQETVLVEVTDMCGPCTFGEAETLNGNW